MLEEQCPTLPTRRNRDLRTNGQDECLVGTARGRAAEDYRLAEWHGEARGEKRLGLHGFSLKGAARDPRQPNPNSRAARAPCAALDRGHFSTQGEAILARGDGEREQLALRRRRRSFAEQMVALVTKEST